MIVIIMHRPESQNTQEINTSWIDSAESRTMDIEPRFVLGHDTGKNTEKIKFR